VFILWLRLQKLIQVGLTVHKIIRLRQSVHIEILDVRLIFLHTLAHVWISLSNNYLCWIWLYLFCNLLLKVDFQLALSVCKLSLLKVFKPEVALWELYVLK
jgi:hypothetical protein